MKTPILAAALTLATAPALAQANWAQPAEPYRIIDNAYSTFIVNDAATSTTLPVGSPSPSRRTLEAVACSGPLTSPVPASVSASRSVLVAAGFTSGSKTWA